MGRISLSGWRRIFSRAISTANSARLFSLAAAVAFYGILALAPAVTVFVSVYGLLADPHVVVSQLAPFTTFFPDAARDLVIDQAQRIASSSGRSLSFGLITGLAVAAWSATAAAKALFDSLNAIYGESEKRSLIRLNAIALTVTIGAVVWMVIAILFVAAEPALVTRLTPRLGGAIAFAVAWLRWPIFLTLAATSIAVLYRVGPSRSRPPHAPLWPGALIAAALWGVSSEAFGWYVSRLGNYQAVYGSLATVAIFLTWIWLSASAVLIGAILDAQIERETSPDVSRS
ncbi:MAG TPA: YihY/virulence factor BrkB family protein [Roseiarcus sp.]